MRRIGLVSLLAAWQAVPLGEIVGEVRDSAGAVVPNAAVTATNVATDAVRSTTTNEAGLYTFPSWCRCRPT
jgi:hypothetical protein